MRFRKTYLTINLLILIIFGAASSKLDIDLGIENLFPRNCPEMLSFNFLNHHFGRDDGIIILIASPKTKWNSDSVKALDRLSVEIRKIEYINDSYSMFDVPYPHFSEDSEISLKPLRNWLFPNEEFELSRFQSFIASLSLNDPFTGNFFSPDSNSAIVMLRLKAGKEDHKGRHQATQNIREWLMNSAFQKYFSFTLTGLPTARADGMRLIQSDQRRLLPIALLITIMVLFWIFSRWIDVFLIISLVLYSIIVTLGIMGFFGLTFSMLSSVLPVIILTTGSSYSIHIISRLRVRQKLCNSGKENESRRWDDEFLAESFTETLNPIFLANITTVIGFLSLYSSNMKIVNEFACVTALGVFVAFLASIFVFPLLVASFPPSENERNPFGIRILKRIIIRIAILDIKHSKLVAGILFSFIFAAIYFAAKVQVKAFVFDDFPQNSKFIQDIRKAEKTCHGILPFSVIIENTNQGKVILRLKYLQIALKITSFLRLQPEVGKLDSPTDMISRVYSMLVEGKQSSKLFPRSDFEAASTMQFMSANEIRDPGITMISPDLSSLQIPFRIKDLDSNRAIDFIDRMEMHLKRFEDSETKIHLTGSTRMIEEAYRNIFANLVSSFSIVAVFTLLVIIFTFPDIVSFSAIVWGNIIPTIMIISLMGIIGVDYKPSTNTIFGIALGLAIDNTIHFLKTRLYYISLGFSNSKAILHALRRAGVGMFVSSAATFFGFLTLIFSEFEAQYLIGLLMSFSVFAALIYDLFFVPSVMAWKGKILHL
ncbi:MAG: MMPL family transporter [Candidatus Riflebacteria bacterium]|nr:MMPL family transporter [Candidatus Riflebacteria bacterium]